MFCKWTESLKSLCWVRNGSGVCSQLILFPFSLRIMSRRKQKIHSIKNIWTAGHCIQSKRHMNGCSESEVVVKQIFNWDHKFFTCKKYVVCKSQVEIDHTFTEISLNLADFLNINVISLYFHFLQGILSHPLCYLKRALFKARKSWIFKIFFEASAKRNASDLTEFRNRSPLHKVSEGIGDRFILTDLVIIHTRFGSSQPPVSLEI